MSDMPPIENAVKETAAAIQRSGNGEMGTLMKVLYLDEQGNPVGEYHSNQLPENQFQGQMQGLQEPPLSLEQLVWLAECHPAHSAAIEQKTADIVGKGWTWEAPDDKDADPEERDSMDAWFRSLCPGEEDMREVLSAVWNDKETTGTGYIEFTRDPSGIVRRAFHVPSHTIRAEKTGMKLCQIRENRKVWFKRWGAVDDAGNPIRVDSVTGSITNITHEATDLFVVKSPSRRSSFYGIPGYVSAIGWITLALAARDDNLMLFTNRREPRWAIILSNLGSQTSNGESMEEQIRRAFTVDMKSPHRNIIIPIEGQGKIDFTKLSADLKVDGSFDALLKAADTQILIAHRVPADRLANSATGPLGGNSNAAANRVYKDGVVTAGQEVLNSRLNQFIMKEYPMSTAATKRRSTRVAALKAAGGDETLPENTPQAWQISMEDLDVETDQDELNLIVMKFKADLITLREARAAMKLEPLMLAPEVPVDPVTGEPDPNFDPSTAEEVESPLNDKLYSELPGVAKGGDGSGGGAGIAGTPDGVPVAADGAAQDARDQALTVMTQDVREVLRQSREVADAVAELRERDSN